MKNLIKLNILIFTFGILFTGCGDNSSNSQNNKNNFDNISMENSLSNCSYYNLAAKYAVDRTDYIIQDLNDFEGLKQTGKEYIRARDQSHPIESTSDSDMNCLELVYLNLDEATQRFESFETINYSIGQQQEMLKRIKQLDEFEENIGIDPNNLLTTY